MGKFHLPALVLVALPIVTALFLFTTAKSLFAAETPGTCTGTSGFNCRCVCPEDSFVMYGRQDNCTDFGATCGGSCTCTINCGNHSEADCPTGCFPYNGYCYGSPPVTLPPQRYSCDQIDIVTCPSVPGCSPGDSGCQGTYLPISACASLDRNGCPNVPGCTSISTGHNGQVCTAGTSALTPVAPSPTANPKMEDCNEVDEDCCTGYGIGTRCDPNGGVWCDLDTMKCILWSDQLIPFELCDTTTDDNSHEQCMTCLRQNNSIWTAIGCIPTSTEGFAGFFLTFAIGIGGGLALLLMIYGAFLMATSAGNPETTQKGKQVFGGAIMGLLFIIFSVVLLQIIGIEILQLPGF